MTKDDYVSPSGIGPLFDAGLAAGRDAALADTLGMLEALAKMVGEVHTKKWWISYDKHTDQFTYRRYLYFSFSGDSITATRAEAEALLGKRGKLNEQYATFCL